MGLSLQLLMSSSDYKVVPSLNRKRNPSLSVVQTSQLARKIRDRRKTCEKSVSSSTLCWWDCLLCKARTLNKSPKSILCPLLVQFGARSARRRRILLRSSLWEVIWGKIRSSYFWLTLGCRNSAMLSPLLTFPCQLIRFTIYSAPI